MQFHTTFFAMTCFWNNGSHDASYVCWSPSGHAAPAAGEWAALPRCFRAPPLPDSAGQRARRTPLPACRARGLHHTNRPQRRASLPSRARGLLASPLVAPQTGCPPVGRGPVRAAAGDLARKSACVRQAHQPLDAGAAGQGLRRAGSDSWGGQYRGDPSRPPADAGQLETGQALDHQPRPPIRRKKKQRDRLIRLADAHADGVLGFADEVWWSRLAQPELHAWAEGKPMRLQEMTLPKDDTDPKARSEERR